jgi:hypothetical protein
MVNDLKITSLILKYNFMIAFCNFYLSKCNLCITFAE